MKKYKMTIAPFIMILIFQAFCIYNLIYDNNQPIEVFIYSVCSIVFVFSFINMFFCYTIVDNEGIKQYTLTKKNQISWSKTNFVGLNIKFVLFKYSVAVCGNGKKINLTNWIKDSKELIKIIVDECKKRDIKIDPMVEKIIED